MSHLSSVNRVIYPASEIDLTGQAHSVTDVNGEEDAIFLKGNYPIQT